MTFVATVAAIQQVGARPVLVDIDPLTRTLEPRSVDRAVTGRTKAILPVHLHGGMADMEAIAGIAEAYGLTVIDAAVATRAFNTLFFTSALTSAKGCAAAGTCLSMWITTEWSLPRSISPELFP